LPAARPSWPRVSPRVSRAPGVPHQPPRTQYATRKRPRERSGGRCVGEGRDHRLAGGRHQACRGHASRVHAVSRPTRSWICSRGSIRSGPAKK
jgi:hypothetical protein